MERLHHTIEPVFDASSKILILGTFPSVKSREGQFFYHHPQNRFWKVLAVLLQEELPQSVEEKKQFLHRNHIAVWDVVSSCEVSGSSDSSIKNVVPNDLAGMLSKLSIQKLYANGAKAYLLYQKYCQKELNRDIIKLPSTSPANAIYQLDRLLLEWKQILKTLEK